MSAGPRVPVHISVVVCAYTVERWTNLVEAIESVRRQTVPPLEVILVVDHDEALLNRARASLPGVAVVENQAARGLSGARNSGVAATRGDVVAFLDDDAVAEPTWLECLAAPYSEPHVAGVGGRIEARWSGGGPPPGFPAEFHWVVGCSYKGLPTVRSPVRNLIGANMSFRRQVLHRVGGFRDGFGRLGCRPLGCEETELCIRAHRLIGARFVYEPRARVHHTVTVARTTWGYFGSRCFAEGLSKARVSASAGAGDALASEREYVRRTLATGVLRGVSDALRGDRRGLTRASAIVAGLLLTGAGYATGTVRDLRATP